MDHLTQLKAISSSIETLMGDASFIDQLEGDDQSFLDTIWDYFDRLAAEFDPAIVLFDNLEPNWEIQQDAETD
jgi:hypothetical protein